MIPKKRKIFFVDNDPQTQAAIAQILSETNCDVTCFTDVQTCLSEVQQAGCHLMISDMKMPGMDGIEFLDTMKRLAPWIPVILLTRDRDIDMAVRATKMGAEDFIQKPFDQPVFINKIKSILSRNEYDGLAIASQLTNTEKKVLKMILSGLNNKEIALKMNCGVRAVEFHHTHIYRKFGVDNAVDLTKKAMAMYTIEDNDKASITS